MVTFSGQYNTYAFYGGILKKKKKMKQKEKVEDERENKNIKPTAFQYRFSNYLRKEGHYFLHVAGNNVVGFCPILLFIFTYQLESCWSP